jgi:hypothetical protein
MDMLFQGFIAAATILWLLSYIGLRRVFAYNWFWDVVITLSLIIMFSGSYAGMMTGLIGGILVSLFLRFGRKFLGVERLTLRRRYGRIIPSLVWVRSSS